MKVTGFVFATAILLGTTAQAQQTVGMNLIHHNIKSGGQAARAAAHIEDLLTTTPKKALVLLNEANYARAHFDLPYPGWSHIWRGTPHAGRGNAIFVRQAVATMKASWVMEMEETWTHNNVHPPRIFPVVKCQLVNNPWVEFHCVTVHFPTNRPGNETARQECVDRLIELSNSVPQLPLIICGDFNMGITRVRQRIANPIGGRVYSNASVDHIIVRDGTSVVFDDNVKVTRLGKLISDHFALRYNVIFRNTAQHSAVMDWSIY